jgi:UDP-glucose 4-epimerase
MHVIITGGAGFIGAHSARELLSQGHRVTVVDDLSHGKREAVPEGAVLHVLDVRSPQLPGLFAQLRAGAVLHLAAQMDVRKSVADPLFDGSVNVLGTINVLESARRAGIHRVVFASSGGAIYGEQESFPARENHPRRPASPYGTSKLCGEEYLAHYERACGLSTLALRYSNVYGPGQDPHGEAGVVAIFLEKMLSGGDPVINGDGLQTRDYVHVADVARVNQLAIEASIQGALNIGTAIEITVVELASRLAREAGYTRPFRHGPAKPGEQRRSCLDPAAARESLGWMPRIGLDEGVASTARWFAASR